MVDNGSQTRVIIPSRRSDISIRTSITLAVEEISVTVIRMLGRKENLVALRMNII